MPNDSWWGHRYKVTSLTGYPINPNSPNLARYGKKRTEWYVLDKAYCHRIVASFKGQNSEARARQLCHELNADERRWEKNP
jgi:hypothetical protein